MKRWRRSSSLGGKAESAAAAALERALADAEPLDKLGDVAISGSISASWQARMRASSGTGPIAADRGNGR